MERLDATNLGTIHHQGQAVGNLYLANKRDVDKFSQEDQRAIELLAAHAGAAVYQAHLKDELGRERSRLRAILKSAPHGVIFVEGSTMKILANPRAVELFGRSLPTDAPGEVEYRGEFFTADGTPIADQDRLARRVLRGEVVPPQELLVLQPNGSMRPVLVSVAPVVQGGRIEGAVIVFEDISAIKDLQRQREEWAAIITHDLRQPLNVLMLYVNLLQSLPAQPNPEDFLKIANQMQKSAETLNRMTSDLADVSRIETRQLTLDRQLVDLASLAHSVVDQQRLASGRSISLIVAGEIPSVDADPMRIEQVLVNLLLNALKYSEPGTAIDVEVRQEGQEVRVLVTNRGPSIAADELPQLFDRYYRTARARAGRARGLAWDLTLPGG